MMVTLDILSGHMNTEACHAVCGMLSQNTTLKQGVSLAYTVYSDLRPWSKS